MNGMAWVRVGAACGALAVAAGAFGAHWLKKTLEPPDLVTFETGVRYQMYHALALLGLGLLATVAPAGPALRAAGWSFVVGIGLFSGSLYGVALGGPHWLVFATPVGGVAFLVGWVALAVAATRAAPRPSV
ncbi:MAG TPA: DUF423 domain-containing protein [Isosphaeraceae bacterium]|jgi:uncharacterized membrane protein YgdD (TMEM256/DUF423 family)|nr:DUF423 domain-containing protein [Isosphaeraceae bacterium]